MANLKKSIITSAIMGGFGGALVGWAASGIDLGKKDSVPYDFSFEAGEIQRGNLETTIKYNGRHIEVLPCIQNGETTAYLVPGFANLGYGIPLWDSKGQDQKYFRFDLAIPIPKRLQPTITEIIKKQNQNNLPVFFVDESITSKF